MAVIRQGGNERHQAFHLRIEMRHDLRVAVKAFVAIDLGDEIEDLPVPRASH
jgi:hypothetical protein